MNKEVTELAADNLIQVRLNPELVKDAKVVFVKSFEKDYDTNNNLANEIFRWFIESHKKVADGAKKQKSA
ncbi:MAG: hypothetical protein CK427_06205 [Leptospira sp.]|nr:MAG: hypothetical protein CK427_06205 [Leptospira sp.]